MVVRACVCVGGERDAVFVVPVNVGVNSLSSNRISISVIVRKFVDMIMVTDSVIFVVAVISNSIIIIISSVINFITITTLSLIIITMVLCHYHYCHRHHHQRNDTATRVIKP